MTVAVAYIFGGEFAAVVEPLLEALPCNSSSQSQCSDQLEVSKRETMELHYTVIFFFQVIWQSQFCKSSKEHRKLGYFQSLLNCNTLRVDPENAVDASCEFLHTCREPLYKFSIKKVSSLSNRSDLYRVREGGSRQ